MCIDYDVVKRPSQANAHHVNNQWYTMAKNCHDSTYLPIQTTMGRKLLTQPQSLTWFRIPEAHHSTSTNQHFHPYRCGFEKCLFHPSNRCPGYPCPRLWPVGDGHMVVFKQSMRCSHFIFDMYVSHCLHPMIFIYIYIHFEYIKYMYIYIHIYIYPLL